MSMHSALPSRNSDLSDINTSSLWTCKLETREEQSRFELLRLAFFVLKLRKTKAEDVLAADDETFDEQTVVQVQQAHDYRCSLLQHAIFQQVLALTTLGEREKALQIIAACA